MSFPPIPKNSITITVNGWLVDTALRNLFKNHLPGFTPVITSAYRTAAQQAEMIAKGYKPSPTSAHLYNLARDFVITDEASGRILSDDEMKNLWEQNINPYWHGYTYYSPKKDWTNTGWIHVNLDRGVTEGTRFIGYAGSAVMVGLGMKKVIEILKKKGRS